MREFGIGLDHPLGGDYVHPSLTHPDVTLFYSMSNVGFFDHATVLTIAIPCLSPINIVSLCSDVSVNRAASSHAEVVVVHSW